MNPNFSSGEIFIDDYLQRPNMLFQEMPCVWGFQTVSELSRPNIRGTMGPNIEVTSDLTFVTPKYVFDVRCHVRCYVTSMLGVTLGLKAYYKHVSRLK